MSQNMLYMVTVGILGNVDMCQNIVA